MGGTLRLLPRCSTPTALHCTSVTTRTELALVAPVPSGQPVPSSEARVFTLGTEGDGQPEAPVDWAALLEGTTWRKPL